MSPPKFLDSRCVIYFTFLRMYVIQYLNIVYRRFFMIVNIIYLFKFCLFTFYSKTNALLYFRTYVASFAETTTSLYRRSTVVAGRSVGRVPSSAGGLEGTPVIQK